MDSTLWQPVLGEMSVCYKLENDPLEVKFIPSTWSPQIASIGHIREVLKLPTLEAVLCFQILLNAVIDEGQVMVELNSIIDFLKWTPDSRIAD